MVTRRRDARVGHRGAARPCACAARMGQEKASSRSPEAGRRAIYVATCSLGCACTIRSFRERACRARYACARGLGRAGRKWSRGAREVEGEPHSGTEREGGASASPELTAPALFPATPSRAPASAGAGFRGREGGERGGGWRLGWGWMPRRS